MDGSFCNAIARFTRLHSSSQRYKVGDFRSSSSSVYDIYDTLGPYDNCTLIVRGVLAAQYSMLTSRIDKETVFHRFLEIYGL